MKNLLLLLFILVFTRSSYSQSGWNTQNSGITAGLGDIQFLDDNTGFTVASPGKFLKTTNGGLNWIVSNIGFSATTVYSVKMLNSNTGFISAYYRSEARILRTTDGGITWDSTAMPQGRKVFFLNSLFGWSDKNYKTTNGGLTWFTLGVLPTNYISDLYFTSESTGYYCSSKENWINPQIVQHSGVIYKTTNGGNNWVQVYGTGFFTGGTYEIGKIQFVNNNTGDAMGTYGSTYDRYLYITTNTGNSWTTILLPTYNGYLFNSIQFSSPVTGWIVGSKGLILKTTNSGVNWVRQECDTTRFLVKITMLNDTKGWIACDSGKVLYTSTGGTSEINQISTLIPSRHSLSQNYPNPFNPATNIEFSLPEKSFVKLKIFDFLGREVSELVNENLSAGTYRYNFNGINLASGMYFYKLETENFSETKKMVLVK